VNLDRVIVPETRVSRGAIIEKRKIHTLLDASSINARTKGEWPPIAIRDIYLILFDLSYYSVSLGLGILELNLCISMK
jgi:hypothetical protein